MSELSEWLAASRLIIPPRTDHAYWGRLGKRRVPKKTRAQIKRAKARKAQRIARRRNRP